MGAVWHRLSVTLARPAIAPVSARLRALGSVGVQEDVPEGVEVRYRQPWDKGPMPRAPRQVRLRAWFEAPLSDADVAGALDGWAHADLAWDVQAEEDWANGWKAHFQPVRVSERLVIAAPWHEVPGALVIEPGNAFGTGEHHTTRACLRAVDRYAAAGATLLDVGCGSGILALAGAKLGMVVRGIDIDPEAVRAAREACVQNGLEARFDTTPVEALEGSYDLVVANLFAEVLVALAPHIRRLAHGPIAMAGILADRADLVRAAYAGRPVWLDATEEGWTEIVVGPEVDVGRGVAPPATPPATG
ncbi:MAG: hypothetical protein RLZZ299_2699 [Pseudomonadota bacterium]